MQSNKIQTGVEYVVTSNRWNSDSEKFRGYGFSTGVALAVGFDESRLHRSRYSRDNVSNGVLLAVAPENYGYSSGLTETVEYDWTDSDGDKHTSAKHVPIATTLKVVRPVDVRIPLADYVTEKAAYEAREVVLKQEQKVRSAQKARKDARVKLLTEEAQAETGISLSYYSEGLRIYGDQEKLLQFVRLGAALQYAVANESVDLSDLNPEVATALAALGSLDDVVARVDSGRVKLAESREWTRKQNESWDAARKAREAEDAEMAANEAAKSE